MHGDKQEHKIQIIRAISVYTEIYTCGTWTAAVTPRALQKKEGNQVESTGLTSLMSLNRVSANSEARNTLKTELSHRQP